MERRTFLRGTSLAAASLILPSSLRAQSPLITSNADALVSLEEKPLRTIAFGSCNKTTHDQSYWSLVGRDKPDLWIWMGDNIYGDTTTMRTRRIMYDGLKSLPLYQEFRGNTPIIGTWDDHDFGFNNASGSYWSREESQAMFCDFMDLPQDSAARQQDGVYQTYTFGPAGKRTQVILLDLRYNMNKARNEREILGEAQWQWFERTLAQSTADLLVIGSSLAVTSNVALLGLEGWHEYGADRLRLYDAISKTDIPAIFLTGDRHFAELYRVTLPSGRIIHEAMSSGLTHTTPVPVPHEGKISPFIGKKNYGVLQIDWTATGPSVNMQIKSTEKYGVLAEARTQFV